MFSREYLEELNRRFGKYFDVDNDLSILNRDIDLAARFKVTNTRHFITKKDIVDSYENVEYCFAKSYERIEDPVFEDFILFLKTACREFVKPGPSHMSTYITGIMISEAAINDKIKKFVKRFKHIRPYKLYLNGWSEIRLVLVDLESEKITVNKSAEKVKKVYQLTP